MIYFYVNFFAYLLYNLLTVLGTEPPAMNKKRQRKQQNLKKQRRQKAESAKITKDDVNAGIYRF